MEKSVRHPTRTSASETADAMAAPSLVAVPLPSSSRATSECRVTPRSIAAVSPSSTMNVDCPAPTSSLAPARTKTASAADIRNDAAGTSAPTCARIAARHVWRRSVDFPPMFGPVRSKKEGDESPPSDASLGTNAAPPAMVAAHG